MFKTLIIFEIFLSLCEFGGHHTQLDIIPAVAFCGKNVEKFSANGYHVSVRLRRGK